MRSFIPSVKEITADTGKEMACHHILKIHHSMLSLAAVTLCSIAVSEIFIIFHTKGLAAAQCINT